MDDARSADAPSPQTTHVKKRRHWWVLGGIVASLLLFITLLPLVIEWVAEKWLRDNGAPTEIANVDLNLFTGQFRMEGLDGGDGLKVGRALFAIDYLPLFSHRLHITAIELDDVDLRVRINDSGAVALGALQLPRPAAGAEQVPATEQEPLPWGFGLDSLVLRQVQVGLVHPRHTLSVAVAHLNLGRVATWAAASPSVLSLKMAVDGAPLSLTMEMTPFDTAPLLKGTMTLDALQLAHYAPLLRDAGVEQLRGSLGAQLEFNLQRSEDKIVQASLEGAVTLEDLHLERADMVVDQQLLNWQGSARAELSEGGAPSFFMSADLSSGDLRVARRDKSLILAAWRELQLKGINVETQANIGLERISAKDVELLGGGRPREGVARMVSLKGAQLDGLTLEDKRQLAAEALTLNGLQVALLLDGQGGLRWLKDLQGEPGEKAPEKPSEKSASESAPASSSSSSNEQMTVRLKHLQLKGKNRLLFEDESVEPPYRLQVTPLTLALNNIDSSRPDAASALTLDASFGDYSKLHLAGKLYPFQSPLSMKLKGDLKGFDLPPLSPYSARSVGYDLERGTLDAKLNIGIDHGALDIHNQLHLAKLKLAEKNSEQAKKFSEQLAMPLDVALGMLRDGDGNIEFDLPVQGDLSSPEFSMSGVVKLALAKGMKATAFKYVTGALQPLGTVLFVGKLFGKATAARFEPLKYAPGAEMPDETGLAYLDKIGTLLVKRPEMKLTFCGVATPADVEPVRERWLAQQPPAKAAKKGEVPPPPLMDETQLFEQLQQLADARGAHAKTYLVESAGIAPERLFSCRPTVEREGQEPPRLEIGL